MTCWRCGRWRGTTPPSSRSRAGRWRDWRISASASAGFVDHSSHDRRHLLTDREATAAGEAAEALGGTEP